MSPSLPQLWHLLQLLLWFHCILRGEALQANSESQLTLLQGQVDNPSKDGAHFLQDDTKLALIQARAVVTPAHGQAASPSRHSRKPQQWSELFDGSAITHPLSMATWCTMFLTTLSLVVFIAWSFASNIDELSGRGKPSKVTDVLVTASRTLSYPPVCCTIFIASQMHKLVVTNGFDGTSMSAAVCMLMASAGIVLEFLCVFLVPFFGRIPKGQMLSKITFMSHCDVHADLENFEAVKSALPSTLVVLSRMAMLWMYVGMFGLVFSLVAKGVESHASEFLSAPLTCVVILGIMYLAVHLCLWWTTESEAIKDARPWKIGSHEVRIKLMPKRSVCHAAALSAAMTMRRAPMIAILFLTDRLHTLDILGWSAPSSFMSNPLCVFTTVAFVFECVLSAFVGAQGKEETGYSDAHIYTSGWKVKFAQFCCNCLTHAGLFLNLYLLIFLTHRADDLLPTSIIVVMALCCLFFVCHFSQAVAFFLKDVCEINFKMLQDTTIAACASVAVCPMVSILLVAARLRAVQITDRNGSSQLWAQTAMYLIGFAIVVQAACCLFLPLFAGLSKREIEEEEDEELQPLLGIGAYVVIAVKYFALICIVAGAIAVCISIYAITPETATYGDYVGHFELLQYTVVAVLAVLLALCLSSAKVVGLGITLAVERAARSHLGIDIKVDKAALSLCDGWVYIKDVIVYNLQKGGVEFQSPHLIKCKKVVLQLDIWTLLQTRGKKVIIHKVDVSGVDVLVEKHSFSEMSNLQVFIRHLDGTVASDEGCPYPLGFMDSACKPCVQKVRLEGARMQRSLQKIKELKDASFVSLHDVSVNGLQAAIWHRREAVLDMPLQDVAIDVQGKDVAPFEIIEMLLFEVLRKVSQSNEFRKRLLQLMGERLANNMMNCFPCKSEAGLQNGPLMRSDVADEGENSSSSTVPIDETRRKKRRPE